MDLIRNTGDVGKYVVIDTRLFDSVPSTFEGLMQELTKHPEAVKFGSPGSKDEFFVVMLKDTCAEVALTAYAQHAASFDKEYASAVLDLADRAGPNSPWCKRPD